MKELVDKERLELELHRWGVETKLCDDEHEELDTIVNSCTLSPAELAEILPNSRQVSLKGDSWVLGELKKEIEATKRYRAASWAYFKIMIEQLESQAPVSKLAKQADKDKRRAMAWDELYLIMLSPASYLIEDSAINYKKVVKDIMDRLHSPPEAKEEK